jgi:hypothetical protein
MFKVCDLCNEFRYFSKPHKLDCDMCEAVINYEIKKGIIPKETKKRVNR